jgi:hypothetical protein
MARAAILPATAATFLVLIDAFDLQVLGFWARLLYWFALLSMGQTAVFALRGMMDRLGISPTRNALGVLAVCIPASVPITVAVWLVTMEALSEPLRFARLPAFWLPVLVIMAAMAAINLLIDRRPLKTHAEVVPGGGATGAQRAPIIARLRPRLRAADIHAAQAEDHYVHVFTSAGSDLVLMRFSDALDELRGIEGAQVHRSWWVARGAVNGSWREHGKLCLVLTGGTRAPVSRTYARALRHEGWL